MVKRRKKNQNSEIIFYFNYFNYFKLVSSFMKVYRTCFKRNFKILLNLLSFCSVVVGVLNSFNQKLLIFFYILSLTKTSSLSSR